MADVTKIKLPNGSEYDIKDSVSGYITAQTTLAGYGITDAKIENGSIILGSNSITPLTSFTETDPTVPAWAKAASKPTYTAAEVNAIPTSAKGVASGVAELDSNGLVPTSQLPIDVLDVEFYSDEFGYGCTQSYSSISSAIQSEKIINAYYYASISGVRRELLYGSSPSNNVINFYYITETSITRYTIDYWNEVTHASYNIGDMLKSTYDTNNNGKIDKAEGDEDGLNIKTYYALKSELPTIPTNISAFTNDAGYITSYTETDPVFTASAAYGITSTDITNWNNKVSDDHNWGGVSLGSGRIDSTSDQWIPCKGDTNNNSGTAYWIKATQELPTSSSVESIQIPRYKKIDNQWYLQSTTPISTDNSQKVATTAFVQTALSEIDLSGYVASTTTANLTVSSTAPSNPSIGDIWIDTSSL